MAAQMVKVSWDGGRYMLEAWIKGSESYPILTFGLMPSEMAIDGGGSIGIIFREQARRPVSQLLAMLGEPLLA